jgi:hypothetical protein
MINYKKEVAKALNITMTEKLFFAHPNTLTYYLDKFLNPQEKENIKRDFQLAVLVGEYKENEYAKFKKYRLEEDKVIIDILQKKRMAKKERQRKLEEELKKIDEEEIPEETFEEFLAKRHAENAENVEEV